MDGKDDLGHAPRHHDRHHGQHGQDGLFPLRGRGQLCLADQTADCREACGDGKQDHYQDRHPAFIAPACAGLDPVRAAVPHEPECKEEIDQAADVPGQRRADVMGPAMRQENQRERARHRRAVESRADHHRMDERYRIVPASRGRHACLLA
jgi:hypothetical protein